MDDLPDYSRILSAISTCHEPEKLMTFVMNAQKKSVPVVLDAALARLDACRPIHKEGSFEFAFWDMFAAYQNVLLEHKRPTKRLIKAWKRAEAEGEVDALNHWVENAEQAWAFEHLIDQGKLDVTAEKLVLRFSKRFDPQIREQAKARIDAVQRVSA